MKNLDIEDVLIRVLGDVALIHARTTYTKADGQPGAGRYTDVWARRGGELDVRGGQRHAPLRRGPYP